MAAQGYYDENGVWHDPGEDANGNTPTAGDGPITDTPGPPPPVIDQPTTTPPGPTGTAPVFTPPPWSNDSGLPAIPGYTPPPVFASPSPDHIGDDPGYRFRRTEGEDALQHWAAARGTLNDSGTAKALVDYGQNAASQEYQNVWNRAWNTYSTNVKSQYVDPYTFALRGWEDNSAAIQHTNDNAYQRAWDQFLEQMREYELPLHA